MKLFFPIILLLIFVNACAPDPRKEAEAYKTRIEADQNALNSQQNRQQKADLHAVQVEALKVEQGHKEATAAQWREGLNKMIHYGFIFATISLCVSLLALTFSFSYSSVGMAKATVRAMDVRANQIMLDRVTRQFPLFIQHVHGDKYALHNPNAGSVVMLDVSNPADRQLIATSGATQIAGVIAQEASRSADPAGVAIIQPPIVDVEDGSITIGRDIVRRSNE